MYKKLENIYRRDRLEDRVYFFFFERCIKDVLEIAFPFDGAMINLLEHRVIK